ncbi:hypothetical protein PIB30_095711, partial [Stylosanthes scabra]|nr:hypothetical protein [Stylosanthes scabra]
VENKALARPHPPGGAAARSENVILLATGATAPPRPFSVAPARLAHPCDGPGASVSLATFGQSYQVAWCHRAPGAPLMARPHASRTRAMALAHPRGELGHIRPKLPSSMAPARPRDGMSHRGKDIATGTSTPSRVRTSKNSNRGRGEGFPSNRFDHQLHYDRWKGLENRQIVHERIIRLDGDEERIFRSNDPQQSTPSPSL